MVERARGQIVAMGGGGFSMEPTNPLLDDYVLSLSARQPARVCFLPTASGDATQYVVRFYRALSGRCLPADIMLSGELRRPANTSELEEMLSQQDIFYVGGGNTVHLLALWRAHGLDRLLRERWMQGAILCGVSAGMNCWFQSSITDSFGALAGLDDGLGLLQGSACPHYDGNAERRPAFHQALLAGLRGGYAADVGAALHFVGAELKTVVSSRPAARAYRVEVRDGRIEETALETRYLGA